MGMAMVKGNGKAARASARRAPKESVLVASKVKALLRDADCNTAGDALAGLDSWVHWLVTQAAARAHANGRKTVRAHDFMAPP